MTKINLFKATVYSLLFCSMSCKNQVDESNSQPMSQKSSQLHLKNECNETENFLMVEEFLNKCKFAKDSCEVENLINDGYVKLSNSLLFETNLNAKTCEDIQWLTEEDSD